ncbi:flagellar assembly protein FliW [Tumebacillus sp. DT12]|uniref:Flagellar assembly factor FliW n=1 Tax=Tumebacillus lacus TaxID=2995335 RepID=A0ABT3WXS8_9BACL|nr:flagellar assembly protein FliW [Tumebacillus lacus]MCX7569469.1 flagellar assembly protein FliW [Tumebacillus lacus]
MIESIHLGVVEVPEDQVYTFESGLYGLEEYTRFALICLDDSLPFRYLQAVDEPGICMLVGDPFTFRSDYEFDLAEGDVASLGEPQSEHLAVWVTVSAKDTLQDATMNLLAPVVLNVQKRLGRQVVLHNSGYPTREPLFKEGR